MKQVMMTAGILVCLTVSACNPTGGIRTDSNLDCAALISAANSLVVSGKVDSDPAFERRGLVASMTYLNAYAIPKGLKEAEAFEEVKARRAGLVESISTDEIMNRARDCLARSLH